MLKITIKCRLDKIRNDLKNHSDFATAFGEAEKLLKSIINEDLPNKHTDDLGSMLQEEGKRVFSSPEGKKIMDTIFPDNQTQNLEGK